jgi:glucose-6-phosphate isomerase
MIDLQEIAGLPVSLEGTSLIFGKGMETVQPSERTVDEMKPFLMNNNSEFTKPVAYYMYRNVGAKRDVATLNKNHLRYDMTVLDSGKIGQEFVKTIGHYHPFKLGTEVRYPEIYQILHGQAIFIMQKTEVNESKVEDVYLVNAASPEKVVMLPGCGHVTVNIGVEPLVLANVVSGQFASIYESYRKNKGAAYYILDQKGKPKLLPNKLYGSLPKPKILKPKNYFLTLSKEPLYTDATRCPEKFRWLNFPEGFQKELEIEKLFDDISTLQICGKL